MNKYPTFTQHFNTQVLLDRLPFGIDFEISPIKSEVTKTVAGFEFKVIHDLATRESWFFETVEELNGNRKNELTMVSAKLAALVCHAMDLKEPMEGLNLLFNPTAEALENDDFVKIYTENKEDTEKLTSLLRLTQSTNSVNWLRVTFFILSRCDTTWTLSKTAELTNKQIREILEFISVEANGGVALDDTEGNDGDDEEDPEGK